MTTANEYRPVSTKPADKEAVATRVREEVQEAFGKRITTSGDCLKLGEEIYAKTSFKINANTLRRVFKLVKTSYLPSQSTLNILAQYCGYDNVEALLASRDSCVIDQSQFTDKQFLEYLISLFKNIQVKEYNDETFLGLVKVTVNFLQQHPELANKFQKAIAKTANGQNFYFEQFINIDGLNSIFAQGLRYYLNEKKTTEAQIFGHSLLCMRGWLSDDAAACKKHYEAVMDYRLTKSIHPFVCGRYFATQLYHAEMLGLPAEKIFIQAHQVHATLRPARENYRSFPAFEYVMSIALLLTGHFDESLYYIDYGFKHYVNRHNYVEEGFYQTLKLIKSLILAKKGEKKKAKEILKELQPSGFYFLTKKINTVLHLCTVRQIKGVNEEDEALIDELIRDTGFTRITKYLK